MAVHIDIWFMVPGIGAGRGMLSDCMASGRRAILDVFSTPEADGAPARIAESLERCPDTGRVGLRLAANRARDIPEKLLQRISTLVLVSDETSPLPRAGQIRAWRAGGTAVWWEYAPIENPKPQACLFDAVLVRGCESGGMSRAYSVRTLFQPALEFAGETPVIVQGANDGRLAAVFAAMGARGIVLDLAAIRAAEESAGNDAPEQQRVSESNLRRIPAGGDWLNVYLSAAPGDAAEPLAMAGPNVFMPNPAVEAGAPPQADATNLTATQTSGASNPTDIAGAFIRRMQSALDRILRTSEDDLDGMKAEPFLIQGPMGFISVRPAFAASCAGAGFFPSLALTGLDADEIRRMAAETGASGEMPAYALGIAGEPALPPGELEKAFSAKPPSALLLSADQWPFRHAWRAMNAPLWLHVQRASQLLTSAGDGDRVFILEGAESGGRVGYLPATVLWTKIFAEISASRRPTDDLTLVLAGGIDSPRAVLFGMLLAAAFGFRGKLAFQAGTALLATRQAVKDKAISEKYRKTLLQGRTTVVMGSSAGTGLRAVYVLGSGVAQTNTPSPATIRSSIETGFSADTRAALVKAYKDAVSGIADWPVSAGESALNIGEPTDLETLGRGLRGFVGDWPALRAAQHQSDLMDFRAFHRLPAIDLAIVGMGGLFPGAPDLRKYWENILLNRRFISEIPPSRWGQADYRDADRAKTDKTYTWHAGVIDYFRFDSLDCLKFRLSPKAAIETDRTHLLLLKAVGQALESAGPDFHFPAECTVALIGNSMGGENVRRGAVRTHVADAIAVLEGTPEFAALPEDTRNAIVLRLRHEITGGKPVAGQDTLVGGVSGVLAGRIASLLGVRGGNFSVDAACASSLAALAAAAAFISAGLAEAAAIGGVDSELSADTFINFCRLQALASTIGNPYMEGSDGFTMGEGCGALFIKPLETALRDGDRIYARLTGMGMSSDGAEGSLTMPTVDGQKSAIRSAFVASGFSTDSIGYIEGHGTGTLVGDAIELKTLKDIFAAAPPGAIALGSVKAHIGHLKSAAGAASLIKTVLALHHRSIPPAWIQGNLHPEIRDTASPLRLPEKTMPWQRDGVTPRRAAVSSFGFGGSNFHAHIEEAHEKLGLLTATRLLAFSGADRLELREKTEKFIAAAGKAGAVDFYDSAQTSAMAGHGKCRLAAVWDIKTGFDALAGKLRASLSGGNPTGAWFNENARRLKLAFIFPGQGSLQKTPFRQFALTVGCFQRRLFEFSRAAGHDFSVILPGEGMDRPAVSADSRNIALQPACVALGLALADILADIGIAPDMAAGHSLGFYTALGATGALGKNDVLRLVSRRAECFDAVPEADSGCLIALRAGEDDAGTLAGQSPVPAHVSNVNSPFQTVLAVANRHVEALTDFIRSRGFEYSLVPVGWAFHSPIVSGPARAFEAHLETCRFRPPAIRLFSEVTGEEIPAESFDNRFPDWLPRHILMPVRFPALAEELRAKGCEAFLEVGAGGTLTRFVKDSSRDSVQAFTTDSTRPDTLAWWHELLAVLYVNAGMPFDLAAYTDIFSCHLRPIRISNRAPATAACVGSKPRPKKNAGTTGMEPKKLGVSDGRVFDELKAIIAKHTGFEDAVLEADKPLRETYGIDSLKMMEIGADIEKRFNRTLTPGALPQDLTLAALAAHIEKAPSIEAEDAPGKPRRHESAYIPIPIPAQVHSAPRTALVTNDARLAAQWRKRSLGPARTIKNGKPVTAAEVKAMPEVIAGNRLVYAVAGPGPGDNETRWAATHYANLLTFAKTFFKTGRGAHDLFMSAVAGNTGPVTAGFAGFARSLSREAGEATVRHVAIEAAPGPEYTANVLTREAASENDPFPAVVYRRLRRNVETMRETPEPERAAIPALRNDDVILAAGGARGIAADVALRLSEHASPTWLLAGSTNPDADTDAGREARKTIESLRGKGCAAHYIRCDLSKPGAAARLADYCARRFPPPTGVLHCAATTADARLENKSPAAFMRVLRVKALSALELERKVASPSLRFWINFSSLAAFLGNEGQTDYAAANAILDAQVERLKNAGVKCARSVRWSAWAKAGMAASNPALLDRLRARGVAVIEPAEGAAFLERELARGGAGVSGYTGDPAAACQYRPAQMPPWAEVRSAGDRVSARSRPFVLEEPFLRDHQMRGMPVLPGVMALELSAAAAPMRRAPLLWENLRFIRMLAAGRTGIALRLDWRAPTPSSIYFECRETGAGGGPVFGGVMRWRAYRSPAGPCAGIEPFDSEIGAEKLYGPGNLLFSGPTFQALKQNVRLSANGAGAILARDCGRIYGPAGPAQAAVPIATVDGLMQMCAVWLREKKHCLCLPAGVESLWWSGVFPCGEVSARIKIRPPAGAEAGGDSVFDAEAESDGKTLFSIRGLAMRPVAESGA